MRRWIYLEIFLWCLCSVSANAFLLTGLLLGVFQSELVIAADADDLRISALINPSNHDEIGGSGESRLQLLNDTGHARVPLLQCRLYLKGERNSAASSSQLCSRTPIGWSPPPDVWEFWEGGFSLRKSSGD